ncbi:MAG: hypothetical protein IPO14_04505 [Saprospiraceae bacterium]|nr:hypothetical protein [Saprospiraceae bacterium]
MRAITLSETGNDAVIGMVCVNPEDPNTTILVVSEKGNGKRTSLDDYRITNRGGKGVKTINLSEKTGELVTIKSVTEEDQLTHYHPGVGRSLNSQIRILRKEKKELCAWGIFQASKLMTL